MFPTEKMLIRQRGKQSCDNRLEKAFLPSKAAPQNNCFNLKTFWLFTTTLLFLCLLVILVRRPLYPQPDYTYRDGSYYRKEHERVRTPKVSRYLTWVNSNAPDTFLDYINYDVQCTDTKIEDFKLLRKLGEGTYGRAFLAIRRSEWGAEKKPVVVKELKRVRSHRITREVYVMERLCGGPSIIRFIEVACKAAHWNGTLFIYPYFRTVSRHDIRKLSDMQVRWIFYRTLMALEYTHRKGIIHADFKDGNLMIEIDEKVKMTPNNETVFNVHLIDWGLADFYWPGTKYTTRLVTRGLINQSFKWFND